MQFEKYLEFFGNIYNIIFSNKPQKSIGILIMLFGLGRKLYLRKNTTQLKLFQNIVLNYYNLTEINLNEIYEQTKITDQQKIREYFSKEKLKFELKLLFKEVT